MKNKSEKIRKLLTCKLESFNDSANSEKSFHTRLQLVNIIKIYFDFTYYLCLTPFRLVKTEKSYGILYIFHKWKPQQVISLLTFYSINFFVKL